MTASRGDVADLFTRLAQRARHDAVPSVEPEREVEPVIVDADGIEPNPADTELGAGRGSGDRPGWSDVAPVSTPAATPLMPMPAIVPAAARRDASPPFPGTQRAVERTRLNADRPVVLRPAHQPREAPGRTPVSVVSDVVQRIQPPVGEIVAPPTPPVVVARREPAPDATAPPSVEVTIGRVEIRVRPPARVERDRPRPVPKLTAALSLEEYLRRREASS